jgi:hypothetical protein
MAKKKIARVSTKQGAKDSSSESERQKRVRATIKEYRQLSAKLEKLRNGRPRVELSEEELEWRWRQIILHKGFLD